MLCFRLPIVEYNNWAENAGNSKVLTTAAELNLLPPKDGEPRPDQQRLSTKSHPTVILRNAQKLYMFGRTTTAHRTACLYLGLCHVLLLLGDN